MFESLMDALNAPRKGLFQMLGSDDGSGSGLLQNAFGVDPESGLGRYGGMAAEVAGDPLNLIGLGLTAGAGKGTNALLKALRGGEVADAGLGVANATADLGAARRLEQAATDAAGTFNPATMGPGNLPVASLFPEGQQFSRAGDLKWEKLGSANSRQSRSLGSDRVPGNLLNDVEAGTFGPIDKQIDFAQAAQQQAMDPTTAMYGNANNLRTKGMYELKGELGAQYPTDRAEAGDLISDLLAGRGRYNAGQNAALRASETGELGRLGGRPMLTVGDMLGGNADDVAAAAGRNPTFAEALRSAGPGMDATMLQTGGLVPQMDAGLMQAQQRLAMLQAIDPMYGQLATAGVGGAVGGQAGTRAISNNRRRS